MTEVTSYRNETKTKRNEHQLLTSGAHEHVTLSGCAHVALAIHFYSHSGKSKRKIDEEGVTCFCCGPSFPGLFGRLLSYSLFSSPLSPSILFTYTSCPTEAEIHPAAFPREIIQTHLSGFCPDCNHASASKDERTQWVDHPLSLMSLETLLSAFTKVRANLRVNSRVKKAITKNRKKKQRECQGGERKEDERERQLGEQSRTVTREESQYLSTWKAKKKTQTFRAFTTLDMSYELM